MSGPLSNPFMFKSAAGAAGFYTHQIANSCRFDSASSSYLTRSAGTPSNANIATFSCWIKRSNLANMGESSGSPQCIVAGGNEMYEFYDGAHDDKIKWTGGNGGDYITTGEVYRDSSAWYNLVFRYDSTGSTASEYVRIYKNGTLIDPATYTEQSYSAQNEATKIGQSSPVRLGNEGTGSEDNFFDGYMAEVVFCDGQSLDASSFGETKNGVWIPKDPSGLTFGTNGFWLKFSNSANLGEDFSGNNNDFTSSGLGADHQTLDTPTFNDDSNGGNYATWNPLNKGSYTTLSEGNLKATGTSSGASNPSGTFAMTSGKWYWEMLIQELKSGYPYPGLTVLGNIANGATDGGDIWAMRYDIGSGSVGGNSGANITGLGTLTTVATGVATATDGDIISFYLDCDNRKAWIAKNGTIPNSGDPANGTNPQWAWTTTPSNPITFTAQVYNGDDTILNAGQDGTFAGEKTAQGNSDDTGYGNFYYDPPTGFLAMCSGNLPISDAINPAETDDNFPQKLFETLTYTGTGSSGSITTKFQPDFIWMKNRGTTKRHYVVDSNRGINSTSPYLHPDVNVSEGTGNSTGVSAVSSTSISFGGGLDYVNASSNTYVSWHWRANGGTTSTNSTGSLSVTQQVDPSGGFSISTYSGDGGTDTIGHGLSRAPTFVVIKQRNDTNNWAVYAKGAGNTKYAYLDTDGTFGTAAMWQNTTPSSSLVYLGDNNEVNAGSRTYVAYCFADTEGYIKSGSYVGNGNADGSFVYTGFKPAWVMVKNTSATEAWVVADNGRSPFNVVDKILKPNNSNAEATGSTYYCDFLSNGFKPRTTWEGWNQTNTFVYLAFAENPFKYATAR